MLKFVLNPDSNEEFDYEGDFYFSFYEINLYVENFINQIGFIDSNIKNKISSDIILLIKNEYLPYLITHEFNIAKRAGVLDKKNVLKSFLRKSKISLCFLE